MGLWILLWVINSGDLFRIHFYRLLEVITKDIFINIRHFFDFQNLETLPTPFSNLYLSSNFAPRETARVLSSLVGLMTATILITLYAGIP